MTNVSYNCIDRNVDQGHGDDACLYYESAYTKTKLKFTFEEASSLLRVAYACTVHKCQGQEYDYMIMPMTKNITPRS